MATKCEVRRNTRGVRNLEKFEKEPPVKTGELLTAAFMLKKARFENLAEALKEDGRKIEFVEDTKNSSTAWDELIRANTKYVGWDELCTAVNAANA